MSSIPRKNRGYMMLGVILVMMTLALTILLSQAGMITIMKGKRFTETENSLTKISNSLVQFVATNHRLPCPANPGLPTDASDAGFPEQDPILTNAHSTCTYETGVVPWRALGLKPDEAQDEWGRLISYRAYDGAIGLTQSEGASMLNCDTSNITGTIINETPPSSTDGSCNIDHNTLDTSFTNSTAFVSQGGKKGFDINDFGTVVPNVAFLLISHGPSGLGGYLPSGQQLTLPGSTAADYPNTEASPTAFVRAAASDPSVQAGSAGHYDDVVSYLKIIDLAKLAKVAARDWPEALSFNATTTANMTSAGTNHFLSSGISGSGQEFTVTTLPSGNLGVTFGSSANSFAGCLWWPNVLNLSGTVNRLLTVYQEFAADSSNIRDPFPGFTMGFLSGSEPAPTNSTCGTTAITTSATGVLGNNTITVADTTGIVQGLRVTGTGIGTSGAGSFATVNLVDTVTKVVTLNRTNSSDVSGTITFANALMIGRSLGWSGGTLASYSNRFAVEFDAISDTNTSANPPVTSSIDPSRPHLAIDYDGVIHDGTNAESCATNNYGGGCNFDSGGSSSFMVSGLTVFNSIRTEVWPQSCVSKSGLSLTSGNNTFTVAAPSQIAVGMGAYGDHIAPGATVTQVSGTTVTLSLQHIGTATERVDFAVLPATSKTATGISGQSTITVTDIRGIGVGMLASGTGIHAGASVSSVSGTTVTLSSANTDNVSGTVSFTSPTQTKSGTGLAGQSSITVSDVGGVAAGMTASGTGIASGATVTAISGLVISLSIANASDVSGNIVLRPTQTLVKAWTLSSAGCSSNPTACSAMKDVQVTFGTDMSTNTEARHVTACLSPSSSSAYGSLFFGTTTSNQTTRTSGSGNNVIFGGLQIATPTLQ